MDSLGRNRARRNHQIARQLCELGIELMQRISLDLYFNNSVIETSSRLLYAVNRFQTSTKVSAPLTQLRIKVGCG